MPYPPPPPAPGVGEFQAIGLLPAPELPDVTGHNGEFLGTDGVIPEWEAVTGVLPDQTGHAGQFLGTDGTTATWQSVGGGGGLPSQAGHSGQFLTTDGVAASWSPAGGDSAYSIVTHGAVPNDTTNDVAQAFYNTIAAWTAPNNIFPVVTAATIFGAVSFPQGAFYTSMPLCVPPGCEMYGVSTELTTIFPGTGTGLTSTVGSFAGGPVVYGAPAYTPAQLPSANFPAYSTPLVGATGQSLHLEDSSVSPNGDTSRFILHDAWAWSVWMGNTYNLTNWSLQFWVRVDESTSTQFFRGVIGSRGPSVWGPTRGLTLAEDIAFGVYAICDGSNIQLKAYLTTNTDFAGPVSYVPSGIQHTITSGNITTGVPIHVELDYNGSFFDFYVNGVNQGHVSAQGPIIRAPWEGTGIGGQGPETLDPGQLSVSGINGAIDSVRLSNVARHTGTGSFTPPVAKYTWDANTFGLYNWDQGVKTVQPKHPDGSNNGPLLTLPFLVGQSLGSAGDGGSFAPIAIGPVPHYIRLFGSSVSANSTYHDFAINAQQCASGLIISNAQENTVRDVWVNRPTGYGIKNSTAVSYFFDLQKCRVTQCGNIGISVYGPARNCEIQSCGIGIQIVASGLVADIDNQPAYNSYAGVVCNGEGFVGTFQVDRTTYDAEAFRFTRQIAGGVVHGSFASALFNGNTWSPQSSQSPPVMYMSLPVLPNGRATHINDQFHPNTAGTSSFSAPPCSMIEFAGGLPSHNILLINPYVQDLNIPQLPISNVEGWLAIVNGEGTTNLRGQSISDVPANNFAGTFTIQNGFTKGGPLFPTPEPDADYNVQITPQDFLGSAPAAGAERVLFPIEKFQDRFLASVAADPGGTSTAIYAYTITRINPPPLFFSYLPTVPSSFSNPLAGQTNAPFAAGVTIVPASGHTFVLNVTPVPLQAILSSGTTVHGTNWWESAIAGQGGGFTESWGPAAIDFGLNVLNGQLINLLNPGAHNIAIVYDGVGGSVYIDGQTPGRIGALLPPGTQPATVHVGERFDASAPLTTATLRNLKMDVEAARVISIDNDIGPSDMVQGAFIGDEWILGYANTLAIGGAASQISNVSYGTTYYWMAATSQATLTGPSSSNGALVTNVWSNWQGTPSDPPPLASLVILAGLHDILNSKTATTTYASLLNLLEGSAATNTWLPPTSTTSPTQQHALVVFAVPRNPANPGTCIFHFNGFAISSTFTTDGFTTAGILAAALLADSNIGPLILTAVVTGAITTEASVTVRVKATGTAGNGIPVTADGGAGGFLFGDLGGGFGGTGLVVSTFLGLDTTCLIGGVQFIANFDTNADTTVDNLIALVNADPTVGPLVTATRVASQMLVTADADGRAGNDIVVGGSSINTPVPAGNIAWTSGNSVRHLTGGSNGAIQNGIGNILLCTIPPIGTVAGVTAGMKTELTALNVLINAYTGTGVTIVDANVALRNPAAHDNLNPIFDSGLTGVLNNAGQSALYVLLAPHLSGPGTPPSALSYATNPATYASGGPIASNNPTVTGSVTYWTVSPQLPTGLVISSSTGHVTGTPTTPTGAANYTVAASNAAGTTTVALNITIT